MNLLKFIWFVLSLTKGKSDCRNKCRYCNGEFYEKDRISAHICFDCYARNGRCNCGIIRNNDRLCPVCEREEIDRRIRCKILCIQADEQWERIQAQRR